MENWGTRNNRQIFYIPAKQEPNWDKQLPKDNWLALIVGDSREVNRYRDLAAKCLDKNVAYVCTIGHDCELIHDVFDVVIVEKKIDADKSISSIDDFENSPNTTWHEDLYEGIWFATNAAQNNDHQIDKIVIIDVSDQANKKAINELINRMEN